MPRPGIRSCFLVDRGRRGRPGVKCAPNQRLYSLPRGIADAAATGGECKGVIAVSSHAPIARPLRRAGALIVVLAVALSGCGEYSPVGDASGTPDASPPATPDSSATTNADESADDSNGESADDVTTYAFGLPPTDTSVTGNNGPGYGALLRGCESARSYLAGIDLDDQPFFGFTNPRYVAFYSAGLAIECNGDIALARTWTEGAIAEYGLDGTDRLGEPKKPDGSGDPVDPPGPPGYGEPECDLYRTLVSVVRQVDPGSLTCHPGSSPQFRSQVWEISDGPAVMWDDPCTFDIDESTIEPRSALEATPAFCVPVATPPRPVDDGDDETPSPAPTAPLDGPTEIGSEGGGE